MWHIFFFGLILGWSAAIPVGPVNIEIVRRNLGERFFEQGHGWTSVSTQLATISQGGKIDITPLQGFLCV